MRKPGKYFLIILISCVILTALYLVWSVIVPVKSEQLALRVKAGDNAATIAEKLRDRGIIRSRGLFLLLSKLRGTDRNLKAGTYSLGGYHNLLKTLRMLEKGSTDAIRITFPEGLSLYKTLQKIDRSGLADYDELSAAATDSVFVRQLTGFSVPSLEGFLFPETYYFDLGITPQDILRLMTTQFFSQLQEAHVTLDTIPDFYQKLTLASIVEQESGHPDERELIAGVFQNRLDKGINLQSCATVDYVLEKQGIGRKVLSFEDIRTPSPYNSYQNKGLPPGPICNPSLPAILAALHPARTDYLYFVADRHGRNDFSVTGAEHMRKIKQYHRSEWN